jgi:hypothetical protein
MYKKLMLACMAVAAFATSVVAPAASASPVLTENGTAVAVGASIEDKITGVMKFTGAFNVECSSTNLKGTVTKNSGTKLETTIPAGGVTISGTAVGGDCTSALGATKVTINSELCFASGAAPADTFTVTGCSANVVFTLEVTGTGPCKYSTAVVNGTFSTNVTPTTINVSEQEFKKIEGGFFCPSSGKLDMDLDMYTTGTNTGLTIS